MDSNKTTRPDAKGIDMLATITGDKVSVCKAVFYKTATVTESFAKKLPPGELFAGIEAGFIVAVQFAWHTQEGEPVYYIGRVRGEWIGCARESWLTDFVL